MMRVLLSAYSCGPNRGSEPGVGWGAAMSLANYAEVHVLTTFESRESIGAEIAAGHVPESLRFHFFDLPGAAWWWKHGRLRGIQFHYALWQRLAGRVVRRLHKRFLFDAAQHVTFVRYWSPSCLRNSGIPYVFGPVAGADLPPAGLVREYPARQRFVFLARKIIRWFGERNPATLSTLRNAAHVFAATPATRERCLALGVSPERLSLCQAIALTDDEFSVLSSMPFVDAPVFFGMGLLIHRKRYDLAIRAFAEAAIPGSKLVLIGGGPEDSRLRALAERFGVLDRIEITGFLSRQEAWKKMSECSVLLHPCDLESGGCVVQESLAAGRPVVALDMGGPALMVDSSVGEKVFPESSAQIVLSMAAAMRRLEEPGLRRSMAPLCREKVRECAYWPERARMFHASLQKANALACRPDVAPGFQSC